jgi:hypothetical protein
MTLSALSQSTLLGTDLDDEQDDSADLIDDEEDDNL